MEKLTLGFLGTGHMGSAIARCLVAYPLLLNNRTLAKAKALAEELPSAQIEDPIVILKKANFVFLGVKPSDMEALGKQLSGIKSSAILVSMAAGLTLESLSSIFPHHRLIRIMPNTPVAVGKGITFVAYGNITEKDKATFASIMEPCGKLVEIEEKDIDAGSVLTGSAPAYLDFFLDALAEAGTSLGLSKQDALNYVLAMAEGTVALAKDSDFSVKQLGQQVCSPGGSTIEGVEVLLNKGLYPDLALAAASTYYKNKALGGTYRFVGASDALVTPIDPAFAKVLNPYRLYDLLSDLWSKDTCAPRMAHNWSKENKTLGQCSITAFLVQDIFGGEVYGIPLGDGAFHCFNKVGDKIFDLTSEQFLPEILTYPLSYPQSREVHFAKEEKRLRYEALRLSLLKAIS